MKKPLIFLWSCTFCFFFSWSIAQDCTPNNITLNSQMEVDNFQTNHGTCDNVLGNLRINGADITNLSGLSGIVSVQGDLTIFNSDGLTNLGGLEGLTTVGGRLEIIGNAVLENLDELSNLSSAQAIRINSNTALQNFDGLNTLITGDFPGPIEVSNTLSLSLDAFQGLTSLTGTLRLVGNDQLGDISGLSLLSVIGGNFEFSTLSPALQNEDMNPLLNLNTIGGLLEIVNLSAVTNLDFLAGLTSIGGLSLIGNKVLENIDGLSNSFGNALPGTLNISGNDALQNVDPLGGLEIIGGDFAIDNVDIKVPDFTGLSNIHTVNGDINISTTAILTNVDFLCGLKTVGGSLSIATNNLLENIDGVCNVVSIGGGLSIAFNGFLEDLDALSGITSLGDDLGIEGNPILTNIDALGSISFIDGQMRIRNNPLLSTCCGLFPVINDGGVTGPILILDSNAAGCQSEQEIRDGGTCDCRIASITPVKGAEQEKVLVKYVGPNSGTLTVQGQSINVDPNIGGKIEVALDKFPFDGAITANFGADCSLTVQIEQVEPLPLFPLLGKVLFFALVLGLTSFSILRYIKS